VKVERDVAKLRRLLVTTRERANAYVIVVGRKRRHRVREAEDFSTMPGLELVYSTTYVASATTFGASVYLVR